MNRERIEAFIVQLEKHPRIIYMMNWQSKPSLDCVEYGISLTLEELRPCGNKACAGGFLALTPEFQAAGGKPDIGLIGAPLYEGKGGGSAFAEYFDICTSLARGICYAVADRTEELEKYLDKKWDDWEASDLIVILKGILEGKLS